MKKKLLYIVSPLVVLMLLGVAGPSTVTVNHDTFVLGFPSTAQFYGANPVPLTALPATAAFYGANPVPLSALPNIPASQTSGLELGLGNPSANGQVLSSTTNGTRSWINVPNPDAATIQANIENLRLFPVFILPMGPGFYDFELKATITNWTNGTMVYWYASAMDSQPSNPIWDAAPKIFYTNPESSDPRVWRTSNPANSIYAQLGSNAASSKIGELVVIPSKISSSSTWMYKGNINLVWSYARITSSGFEKDALNNVVWHPIVPVDWRNSPINP